MEHRKNAGLGKRKLPNDGTVQEQEPSIKDMCQALKEMESELQNLRDNNNQLRDELLGKDRQLAEIRTLLVDREHKLWNTQTLLDDREQQLAARALLADTKEFETEILRLKCLLAEKNDTNNYAVLVSPEVIQEQTPVSPARTPVSNRANTVQSSVKAIAHCGSFQDEARGSGTDESSSSCVYHMLVESLVGMKFSLKDETEGFSLAIYHEATGYDFSLTWLEQPDGGEWAYKCSSLGTLEKMAFSFKWMKGQTYGSAWTCSLCSSSGYRTSSERTVLGILGGLKMVLVCSFSYCISGPVLHSE